MVNLTINNKKISVEEGTTILEAAKQNDILIPNLCFLENINKIGSCRICVVEIEGYKNLQASCVTNVKEGMVVKTNSAQVKTARKLIYELILSDHSKECLFCFRNQSCEFQKLGELIQIEESRFEGEKSKTFIDDTNPAIIRDSSKCILCRRCVAVCNEIQGVGIINPQHRGFKTTIGPADDLPLGEMNCTFCGQCVNVCPVGALQGKDGIKQTWEALFDEKKVVIVQTAPAVRAALGEEFDYEPGTLVTGKMAAALKNIGFDYVFDTNFAADLTIIEEGTEFLERVKSHFKKHKLLKSNNKMSFKLDAEKSPLPMLTSCSPGWIKFIEHNYPEFLNNVSSCKSPHIMLGALCKSFFAKKLKKDPKDIYVVSVMPCTAKKFEASREELSNDGYLNVDSVLTTRELAKMIKASGIDFKNLSDKEFDSPLGLSSGAADIFGTTGGVMEAAVRTVYEIITGRELPFEKLHVKSLMGLDTIKTAELTFENVIEEWSFLEGFTVKLAVTSGLKGADIILNQIKNGDAQYHFIEIMACPGGCINGGGQPRPTNSSIVSRRMDAIYKEDEMKKLRKSHENPDITKIYQDFLKVPLGEVSHKYLHTHYVKR